MCGSYLHEFVLINVFCKGSGDVWRHGCYDEAVLQFFVSYFRMYQGRGTFETRIHAWNLDLQRLTPSHSYCARTLTRF